MARRKTTETAERAQRRPTRELLVGQLRRLSPDDLYDVMYDFGGLAQRAAPIAIEAMQEGMEEGKEGSFLPRVSVKDLSHAVAAMAQDTGKPSDPDDNDYEDPNA